VELNWLLYHKTY